MPFGIVGRTAPGMRQVAGLGSVYKKGYFLGTNLGHNIVTIVTLQHTCVTAPQCGPLPKLLSCGLCGGMCSTEHLLVSSAG